MLDNLSLLFVHGSLAILFWRLITTPDPDEADKKRPRATERFRRLGRRA